MLSRPTFKRLLFIFGLTVLAPFFIIIFWLIFNSSPDNPSRPNLIDGQAVKPPPRIISTEPLVPGSPVRLVIPVISVETNLESTGLTSQGAVGVPKNPANAAWFDLGPLPGNEGSAVITGHYGRWKNGETSVFDNLYKLRPGDKLQVEDDQGAIISFVVRESRRYDSAAEAPDVFISNDGKSHLNLITCEGAWNEQTKHYPQRLVVFTDRED